MEYLSSQAPASNSGNGTYPINLVLQSPQHNPSNNPIPHTANLGYNPSSRVHEYRIDWSGQSSSPLAAFSSSGSSSSSNETAGGDNEIAGNLFSTSDTDLLPPLSAAGHLSLSHWSNGNGGWSAGPPTQDAKMVVKWVRAYFNGTDPATMKEWEAGCQPGGKVCTIQDYDEKMDGAEVSGPGNGNVPTFLSNGGKGTGQAGGSGGKGGKKNEAANGGLKYLQGVVWSLLIASLPLLS